MSFILPIILLEKIIYDLPQTARVNLSLVSRLFNATVNRVSNREIIWSLLGSDIFLDEKVDPSLKRHIKILSDTKICNLLLIQAFGGILQLGKIPVLAHQNGPMTSPIMRGVKEDGLPFIAFHLIVRNYELDEVTRSIHILSQSGLSNPKIWNEKSQIGPILTVKGNLRWRQESQRLSRLINGQAIGFYHSSIDVNFDDKPHFCPDGKPVIELVTYGENTSQQSSNCQNSSPRNATS